MSELSRQGSGQRLALLAALEIRLRRWRGRVIAVVATLADELAAAIARSDTGRAEGVRLCCRQIDDGPARSLPGDDAPGCDDGFNGCYLLLI